MATAFRLIWILTLFTILCANGAFGASEEPMMKAVIAHEYGAPEVLKFEEVPRPKPKDDEALVRVIASGVNPADPLTLSGKFAKSGERHLPLIPGYEIAGIIEKTGANVTSLKAGRRRLRLSDVRWRLGRIRHGQGMGSRSETEIAQLCGGCGGADGCIDRMASAR